MENEWAECFLLDLVPELKVCQVKSEFFNGIINYVEKRTIFEHSLSKGDARTGGSLAKGPPGGLGMTFWSFAQCLETQPASLDA